MMMEAFLEILSILANMSVLPSNERELLNALVKEFDKPRR